MKRQKGFAKMVDKDAPYTIKSFTPLRKLVMDLMWTARNSNTVHGLWDADVTEARRLFSDYKKRTGESLSFTGFILKCMGQAVANHKDMQACWKGRRGRELVIFDDVDIAAIVEREVDGEKMPASFLLRAANRKSFREINDEIQNAKTAPFGEEGGDVILKRETQRLARLPWFLRRLIYWKAERDPFWRKEYAGTVGFTSVGMFFEGRGWAIPITPMTLTIAVGSIERRPAFVKDQWEKREFLCLTTSIDHDIVDGASAARFLKELKGLIEGNYGLDALLP